MDVEPMVRGSTAADAEDGVSHSATAAAPAGAFVAPLSRRTSRGGRRNRRRRKPGESDPTPAPSVATGAHLAPIVTAAAVADGDGERGGDTRSGGRGRKQGKRRKKRVVAASRGAGPAASLLSPLARATAPRRHDPEGPPWSEPKWAANIRLRDEAFTNFMQIGEGTYGYVAALRSGVGCNWFGCDPRSHPVLIPPLSLRHRCVRASQPSLPRGRPSFGRLRRA